jgi:hypothetical protein
MVSSLASVFLRYSAVVVALWRGGFWTRPRGRKGKVMKRSDIIEPYTWMCFTKARLNSNRSKPSAFPLYVSRIRLSVSAFHNSVACLTCLALSQNTLFPCKLPIFQWLISWNGSVSKSFHDNFSTCNIVTPPRWTVDLYFYHISSEKWL